MSGDLISVVLVLLIGGAIGLAVLYFVVKAAIMNALYDDRLRQAKAASVVDPDGQEHPRG